MPEPIATWNPARDVWETEAVSLFCGHSAGFLETWPASGMTRSGAAYVRPTWVTAIPGGESSSSPLLKTPQASENLTGRPQRYVNQGASRRFDLSDQIAALRLLPTPAVNDMGAGLTVERWDEWTAEMKAKHANGNGHGPSLSVEARRVARAAVTLLPTPRATDGTKGGPNQRGSSGDLMLPSAVQSARWRKYAPAIASHEAALGRPAPAPTEPTGKDGAARLSPRFVEWMMGLEDGWVSDVPGLSRPAQLKLLGNGVVPAQAAAAIADCLAALGVVTEP